MRDVINIILGFIISTIVTWFGAKMYFAANHSANENPLSVVILFFVWIILTALFAVIINLFTKKSNSNPY